MDPRRLEEIERLGDWEIPPDMRSYLATETQRAQLRTYMEELERRKTEALRLYEPSKFQEEFHACKAKECLIQKGNQVGGSLCSFVEIARAVTGCDPHQKYPEKNGIAVCVGYKEEHIGTVIYRYLCMPGAFNIIRDEETGEWRTYRPWADAHRRAERMPAPPLIPPRYIEGEPVWDKRGQRIFKRIDFTTGWELRAYTSGAKPAQGFWANLALFDEDVEDPNWFPEMLMRLSMAEEKTGHRGLLRWNALPHNRNEAMATLVERAEDQEDADEPRTVVIRATAFDNPYMDQRAKEDNAAILESVGEDEYRRRIMGEMATDSVMMYPEFSPRIHGALRPPPPTGYEDLRPEVCRILWERQGQPPPDWCRYVVIDPGHQVCAAVFLAVPPPSLGEFVIQYDELYLTQCDANKFGEGMEGKARDQVFQRFIIDMHGGRLRDIGGGKLPHELYSEALQARGVRSVETGFSFQPACDDTKSRELALHGWLYLRRDGSPRYLIVTERCPNTVKNFKRFKKKIIQDVVTDERNSRTPCHAVECVEYGAAAELKYVAPAYKPRKDTIFDRILGDRQRREAQRKARGQRPGRSTISLGPQGYSS